MLITNFEKLVKIFHEQECDRLSIDESALMGESIPVLKTSQTITDKDIPLAERLINYDNDKARNYVDLIHPDLQNRQHNFEFQVQLLPEN